MTRPTIAARARYVHWRIRQPHDHAWHRTVTWPYRAVFGTVAPTGTMYDDIAATGDPTGGDGYAGYLNGKYADYADTKARFPGKPVKSISVWGTDAVALSADIADCENGDYAPADAALWAHLKITGGYGRPTIYSSTSQYAALVAALAIYGLLFGRDVDWFEAHYDGLPNISSNPGAVAKQYQSTDNYDVSVVYMDWLTGASPTPTPPVPDKEMSMILDPILTLPNGTDIVVQIGQENPPLVYGKGRAALKEWNENSNKELCPIVPGTIPVQRLSGGQVQVFCEQASDAHVVVFATNDGVTWGQLEMG